MSQADILRVDRPSRLSLPQTGQPGFAAKTIREALGGLTQPFGIVYDDNGSLCWLVAILGIGAVSEWFKEAVLKTVVPQGTGGSNPPCSERV